MFSNSRGRFVVPILWQNLRLCAGFVAALLLVSNALASGAPTVVTQPSSQTAIVGTNMTFWVTVDTGSAPPALPAVSSGSLQLWLKADTGVVSNSSGLVGLWQDQSGHANHASQSNPENKPSLVYPPDLGGKPAVRFNGIQDGVNGGFLSGSGNVNVPDAMTAFALYNALSTSNPKNVVWFLGTPGAYGGSRCFGIVDGQLDFSSWAFDYLTPWAIPTNTYRICADRVNASLNTVEFFDNAANGSTNLSEPMSGAIATTPGYYLGGLDPSVSYGAVVNFDGDIAEVLVYQGFLSEADRLAVLDYLQQKYYLSDVNSSISYQWQFDGADITGATNATLTLANIQTNQAGSYSVSVRDLAGSSTSSNAVLTVNLPYPCAPVPAGLVGWWPGDGNTNDIVGGDNGALQFGASFGAGMIGQAFSFDGNNQFLEIPATTSLEPNSVTLECWFNTSNPGNGGNLISKPVGSGTLDSYQIWLENGSLNGLICSFSTEGPILSYALAPTPGVWYHAAYSFDNGTQTQSLYINGAKVASSMASIQIGYDDNAVLVGIDSDNNYGVLPFAGNIDAVSIYSRALTASEIASIYNAGSSGKCGLPASIVAQPLSQNSVVGSNVTISVGVAGTQPLAYQWSFNSAIIQGATNETLVLNDVALGAAGTYAVTVTNAFGSAASSNAVLTVYLAAPCAPVPAGLVGWWPGNGNADDIAGGDNGTLEFGADFGPGIIGESFSFNGNNQFLEIPATPLLEPASVTLECWFNTSNPGNGGSLISKPVGSGTFDSYQIWLENGSLNGLICNASTEGPILSYAFVPTAGIWYHAAYTFDDGTQSQALFLNGAKVASSRAEIPIGYDDNAVLVGIVSDSDYGVLPFEGYIDVV